jgi:hypothetical protein
MRDWFVYQSMASTDDVLASISTDGEVANALVCKTSTHGFDSRSVLQQNKRVIGIFARENNIMATNLR